MKKTLMILAILVAIIGTSAAKVLADTMSEDTWPPIVYSWQPNSTIASEDTTISIDYADASGINIASVVVYLDDEILTSCTATESNVSCPVAALPEGLHHVELTLSDNAGNVGGFTWQFFRYVCADSSVSVVLNPSEGLAGSIIEAIVTYNVTSSTQLRVLMPFNTVYYTGNVSGAGNLVVQVEIPRSLNTGDRRRIVAVLDDCGVSSNQARFIVTGPYVPPAAPALSLTKSKVYWNSYADFTSRSLSIDYSISNKDVRSVYDVQLMGSVNSKAVGSINTPFAIGNISAGDSTPATVMYHVPVGVVAYSTTIYSTAKDNLGNVFAYPGPYPGA